MERRATDVFAEKLRLKDADLLAQVLDNTTAVEALGDADRAIRSWNEAAYGDHIYSDLTRVTNDEGKG